MEDEILLLVINSKNILKGNGAKYKITINLEMINDK